MVSKYAKLHSISPHIFGVNSILITFLYLIAVPDYRQKLVLTCIDPIVLHKSIFLPGWVMGDFIEYM